MTRVIPLESHFPLLGMIVCLGAGCSSAAPDVSSSRHRAEYASEQDDPVLAAIRANADNVRPGMTHDEVIEALGIAADLSPWPSTGGITSAGGGVGVNRFTTSDGRLFIGSSGFPREVDEFWYESSAGHFKHSVRQPTHGPEHDRLSATVFTDPEPVLAALLRNVHRVNRSMDMRRVFEVLDLDHLEPESNGVVVSIGSVTGYSFGKSPDESLTVLRGAGPDDRMSLQYRSKHLTIEFVADYVTGRFSVPAEYLRPIETTTE